MHKEIKMSRAMSLKFSSDHIHLKLFLCFKYEPVVSKNNTDTIDQTNVHANIESNFMGSGR